MGAPKVVALVCLCAAFFACGGESSSEVYKDPSASPADRAKDLLGRLSLDDKLVRQGGGGGGGLRTRVCEREERMDGVKEREENRAWAVKGTEGQEWLGGVARSDA